MSKNIMEKLGYLLSIVILSIQLSVMHSISQNSHELQKQAVTNTTKLMNDYLIVINKTIADKASDLMIFLKNSHKSSDYTKIFNNESFANNSSNQYLHLLLKTIKFKELLGKDLFTKETLQELENFLFHLDNILFDDSIKVDIHKLENKTVSTFTDLHKSLRDIFHQLHYKNAKMLDKILSRSLLIVNKKQYPWNIIFKIDELMNHENWNSALELAKKDLINFTEFSEWIENFERRMTIEKTITSLYEELYKRTSTNQI